MVWIRTIDPEDAEGRLAEAYAWQARKLGRPTEFTQLGSLAPEVVHARLSLYRASEGVPSHLSAEQKLLISYLTSILNDTPHCAALARTVLCASGHERMVRALDANNQCAHLNYTNRVANGLGLKSEPSSAERTPDRISD